VLKLMFVTGSLAHGGAEHHSLNLMNRLAERGHECHAAYVKPDASQLDRIRLRGEGTANCLGAKRFLDWNAVRAFAGVLTSIQPSAIVSANPYALMYSVLASRAAGLSVPLVETYHSTRMLGVREKAKSLLDRLFMWSADCTVFVSEKQKRYSLRRGLGSRRNEVIYNGVDTARFRDLWTANEHAAQRLALGFSRADYVIGLVGLLRPEKNHLQLLDAVAQLRRNGTPAKALLVGDGAMRGAIEMRARALGIERHVVITGFCGDVRPHLAACDVVVLCSVTEAFSLAAIEAMAMGKPVIHSDVGGASEMISAGRNGFLFPVGDTDAFVSRLLFLAAPAVAEGMGREARKMVERRFSEGTMVENYEQLLLGFGAGRELTIGAPSAIAISGRVRRARRT